MSTALGYVFLVLPVVAVIYIVWRYRRAAEDKELRRREREADLFGLMKEQPATPAAPAAPAAPAIAAVPPASPAAVSAAAAAVSPAVAAPARSTVITAVPADATDQAF